MAHSTDLSAKLDIADIRPGSIHSEAAAETTISLRDRDEYAELYTPEANYIKWAIETPFVRVTSVQRDDARYISAVIAEFPQQALRVGPFTGGDTDQPDHHPRQNGQLTIEDLR